MKPASRRLRLVRQPIVVVEIERRATEGEVTMVMKETRKAFPGRRVLVATDGWRVRP
jgi:predicted SnoaL-like aldol condensation-catalyzing enzyme